MQVQKIQNNNYNTNFSANIVDSGSLRKFKSGLSKAEKEVFDSYVKVIEENKDKRNYIFEYLNVGKQNNIKHFSTISIQNPDKTSKFPPVFIDTQENAMNLFKKLADKLTAKKK